MLAAQHKVLVRVVLILASDGSMSYVYMEGLCHALFIGVYNKNFIVHVGYIIYM